MIVVHTYTVARTIRPLSETVIHRPTPVFMTVVGEFDNYLKAYAFSRRIYSYTGCWAIVLRRWILQDDL